MKILAIGAHPDDIEIFMYGLLAILKRNGNEIITCIATDGSEGKISLKKNLKRIRQQEANLGLSKLNTPNFLGLKDGSLAISASASKVISEFIHSIKPDLIITHPPEDYHSDHRSLSRYVTDSSGFYFPVVYSETLLGINFTPDFYFDITPFFKEKSDSILKHKSQNPEKFLKAIELSNRYRSAQCNAPCGCYAEVYRYDKRFPFTDISALLPKTTKIKSFYVNDNQGFL